MDQPCSRCEQTITAGQSYWSVCVNQEVFEDGGVSILDASCTHVFCESCAPKLDLANPTVREIES